MQEAPALICPHCNQPGYGRQCPQCGTYLVNQQALREAPDDPWLGALIGRRYAILQRLGVGGMGAVYRARDERTDKPVAIKFLLKQYANHPAVRARFEAEAAATLAVEHPNVVRLVDFGHEADNTLWLAMEFVQGWTLRDEVNRNGAFTIEQAIRLARQLLSGLAAAHAADLIHRDLKHDNIMFSGDRNNFLVRILDFGIVKNNAFTPSDDTSMLAEETDLPPETDVIPHNFTAAGVLVGSPSYMSPEQIRGLEVHAPADLYSLGVVLYEVLTGRRLFSANDYASLLRDGARRDVPPLYFTANGEAVPADFNRMLQRCLALDPKDRYPDVNTMMLALNQLSAHEEDPLPYDLFAEPPMRLAPLDDAPDTLATTTNAPAHRPFESITLHPEETLLSEVDDKAAPTMSMRTTPKWLPPVVGLGAAIATFALILGLWNIL